MRTGCRLCSTAVCLLSVSLPLWHYDVAAASVVMACNFDKALTKMMREMRFPSHSAAAVLICAKAPELVLGNQTERKCTNHLNHINQSGVCLRLFLRSPSRPLSSYVKVSKIFRSAKLAYILYNLLSSPVVVVLFSCLRCAFDGWSYVLPLRVHGLATRHPLGSRATIIIIFTFHPRAFLWKLSMRLALSFYSVCTSLKVTHTKHEFIFGGELLRSAYFCWCRCYLLDWRLERPTVARRRRRL